VRRSVPDANREFLHGMLPWGPPGIPELLCPLEHGVLEGVSVLVEDPAKILVKGWL